MNVYDFDNTIYDGESFIDLFIFLFKKDPSLVKYIPDVINGLYKYTKGTINAEEALEQYSDVVTDYYNSIEDFDALVTEFWDTNIHKIKPFYFRQRQDDDIIISASPEVLLDDVMHRLNIKNYICSRTDGNAHITDLCFRGRKVELFKEMYPDTIIDNFYTDSVNDGNFRARVPRLRQQDKAGKIKNKNSKPPCDIMRRLLALSKVIMKSERVRDIVGYYLLHYRKRNPHPSK